MPNHNYAEEFPEFGGVIRYEFDIQQAYCAKKLRLERVGETARLWVNGIECGSAVRAPYVFQVESAWQPANNRIVIEIAVNQAYSRRERFSANSVLPPMGLFGDIWLA